MSWVRTDSSVRRVNGGSHRWGRVVESRWIRRSKSEQITESVGEAPTITVGDETIWCRHQGRAGLLYQRGWVDWIEVSRRARWSGDCSGAHDESDTQEGRQHRKILRAQLEPWHFWQLVSGILYILEGLNKTNQFSLQNMNIKCRLMKPINTHGTT